MHVIRKDQMINAQENLMTFQNNLMRWLDDTAQFEGLTYLLVRSMHFCG